MTAMNKQSIEKENDYEIKIKKLSGEAMDAMELFKTEKAELNSKLVSYEEKIQALNEQAVVIENEVAELGDKLLNEDVKMQKEKATLEETQIEMREKEMQILSLNEDLQGMRSQLGVFREQEKELESKIKEV